MKAPSSTKVPGAESTWLSSTALKQRMSISPNQPLTPARSLAVRVAVMGDTLEDPSSDDGGGHLLVGTTDGSPEGGGW